MKKLLFLLLITHYSLLIVEAQTQFQRTIGGTGDDFGASMIQTTDGGYAVAGLTYSFGAGGGDMYIVKLDASGSLQWSRTVGGTGVDYAYSIIQTTDGGYAGTGYTSSFGAGNYDFYIVKLDGSGTLQWSRTIGGADAEYGYSIIQTTDGGYAVAGFTESFGAGSNDFYIVKINGSGTLQWSRTVGGTNSDVGRSIIQTTDGGYAVAGFTESFGTGGFDMHIVKLDASGSLQWSRTVGGTNIDVGYSIIQTTDGGYAVAGSTNSFGAGYYDMYIVKLGASGTLQWTRTVGGAGDDEANSIKQTADGGYAVAGFTNSFGAGLYDFYVLKLSSSGTLQWTKTVGGTNIDYTYSIIQTTDGGYAVAGLTNSFGAGGYDMYIVKLDASGNTCANSTSPSSVSGTGGTLGTPTSTVNSPSSDVTTPTSFTATGGTLTTLCLVGIQPISNEIPASFQLYQNYPNPFNPSTKIRFNIPLLRGVSEGRGVFVQLKIYDILGREVESLVNEQLNAGTYEADWNASNYPSGVYYYKIQTTEYTETKKMILVK